MKGVDASSNFMFITFVSIFALALGVSLSFLRIPIFIVICNGLATRDVRIYSKKGSWEYTNPNNVQRKGIFDLYFQDTTFPLSQKCQWPVHDCFVVRIFPFVKLSHTITQFFCPPCRGRIAYKHMLKRNSKQVLVLLNSMFISHYDEHGRPGVITSTFITPFVCADT